MRFWRRARQRNLTPRENNNNIDGEQNLVFVTPLRRNIFGARPPITTRFNINPFSPRVSQHVPKCLGRVSHSEILQGERVENFSSDCWLQNHLHQFGFVSSSPQNLDIDNACTSTDDDDDDGESPAGSDVTSSCCTSSEEYGLDNSDDNDSDMSGHYFSLAQFNDISQYTAAVEAPPYDCPSEPPPSYEEAIGLHHSRGSSNASSNGAFLW